ncbi:hypothetical protein EV182_006619, partial [Spiromyces aspiralis]
MIVYFVLRLLDPAVENGVGRRGKWIRDLRLWRYLDSYFPCSITLEEPLNPSDQYVLGYHPHGSFVHGLQILGLRKMPELEQHLGDVRVCMNPVALRLPFSGEYYLTLGGVSCSRQSIRALLRSNNSSALIVVGGVPEMLHGEPGKPELCLNNHKGFVREAILSGASLVPLYMFGETSVYRRLPVCPRSAISRANHWFRNKFKIAFPLYYGRCFILPNRTEFHCV